MAIEQCDKPCWLSVCDRCGETFGSDGVDRVHFETEEEAKHGGWEIHDGEVICYTCLDEGCECGGGLKGD